MPPRFFVAVDVADPKLLGKRLEERYAAHIDLCIDHHGSNTLYAAQTLLDASAGAACEVIYEVLRELGVEMDEQIADCIYTGLSTDTGCFRYSNATARTHRIAADMIDCGADAPIINQVMFETKTRTYAALERLALDSLGNLLQRPSGPHYSDAGDVSPERLKRKRVRSDRLAAASD